MSSFLSVSCVFSTVFTDLCLVYFAFWLASLVSISPLSPLVFLLLASLSCLWLSDSIKFDFGYFYLLLLIFFFLKLVKHNVAH